MASEKARKYVAEMLASTDQPGKEFRRTTEDTPERPLGQRVLETVVPAVASTVVGGPLGMGAGRALGMGAKALPAARLVGETLAAGGMGALGLGGGPSGIQGAGEAALGNVLGAGIGAAALPAARAIPGVRGLLSPQLGGKIAGATEADLLLRSRGEGLLLSQAFDSPVVQNAERIFSEAMVAGRGALGRAGARADQAARDLSEEYVKGIISTGGRQEVGQAIEGFLTKKYDVFRAASSSRYAAVDQLAKGVTVDIQPLQQMAADLMKNGEIVGGGAGAILKNVLGRDRYVTFGQAAKLRSSLLAVGREGDSILPEQANAFSKKLAGGLEQQMDRAANALDPATGAQGSPGAWQAYQSAREFHRRGVEPFNDEGIKAIMRRQPEAVAQYLVPLSGQFKTSTIQALKRVSGKDPAALEALQSHYVAELLRTSRREAVDVIERATNPASTRYVSGEKLLDNLNRDTRGLDELLGVQGRQRLTSLASAMARAEKPPGAKGQATLGTAVKYARLMALPGSGLAFQLGGPEIGGGALTTILVAPNAINHMLASPTLRKWLIGGNAPPPGSKTFSRALGQIMSHALAGQRRFGRDAITIQPGEIQLPPEDESVQGIPPF